MHIWEISIGILDGHLLDRLTAVTVLAAVALAIITEKLVWHKRFEKVEKDRDRWQQIALEALLGPAQAGVKAAEVAVSVVSAMPDPGKEKEQI